MGRNGIATYLLVFGSTLALALPTAHAAVSIGSNLGLAISDTQFGSSTDINVPSPRGGAAGVQPGLRVGIAGAKRVHEGYLGASYDMYSAEGRGDHTLRLTVNYQYNGTGTGRLRPFVTVGGGIINEGFHNPPIYVYGSGSATAGTYGLGLGLSRSVSENRGRLRAELRVDRVLEGHGHVESIPWASVYQLVAGFDLWL